MACKHPSAVQGLTHPLSYGAQIINDRKVMNLSLHYIKSLASFLSFTFLNPYPTAITHSSTLRSAMAISRLETLPTETFYNIIEFLVPRDVKRLSRASKRSREVCLPTLFRRVEFRFSKAGFDRLKNFIKSDTRYHVVSFTYIVPELLNAGKYMSIILESILELR
jgi:hypothetical protein